MLVLAWLRYKNCYLAVIYSYYMMALTSIQCCIVALTPYLILLYSYVVLLCIIICHPIKFLWHLISLLFFN